MLFESKSLYKKGVDFNEMFYKLYLFNLKILKQIIKQAQENYDNTDDSRINEIKMHTYPWN